VKKSFPKSRHLAAATIQGTPGRRRRRTNPAGFDGSTGTGRWKLRKGINWRKADSERGDGTADLEAREAMVLACPCSGGGGGGAGRSRDGSRGRFGLLTRGCSIVGCGCGCGAAYRVRTQTHLSVDPASRSQFQRVPTGLEPETHLSQPAQPKPILDGGIEPKNQFRCSCYFFPWLSSPQHQAIVEGVFF
jgi:hypothetical protein